MAYIDFLDETHRSTKRDYLARVLSGNKADFAKTAKKFDYEYWDGSRNTGYGGYTYDGRWLKVATRISEHYGLKAGDRVLDVGCGKGFLLYEFTIALPGVSIAGVDISRYAIDNAKEEVKPFLKEGSAIKLPFADKSFELVVSINTLHNLQLPDLDLALKEIERVAKRSKYIVVDGYRTDEEKVNLLYWQLTCECFFTPKEWDWVFQECGYTGDYGCVFFD
jgi:protein-L-isoaspartate(D-aspartate) O-methyltransferase